MAAKKKKFPRKSAYVACSGGDRANGCTYGCMSCSSCLEVCRKDAIFYNEYGTAEIEEEKCIGCGLCVKACPQDIIHLHMAGMAFLVRCSNHDKGAAAKKVCAVSCIGCGICHKNCPSEAICVTDNCAVINEDECLSCGNCVVKCPRNAIIDTRGIICNIK